MGKVDNRLSKAGEIVRESYWFPSEEPPARRPGFRLLLSGIPLLGIAAFCLPEFFQLRGYVDFRASRVFLLIATVAIVAWLGIVAANLPKWNFGFGIISCLLVVLGAVSIDQIAVSPKSPADTSKASKEIKTPLLKGSVTIGRTKTLAWELRLAVENVGDSPIQAIKCAFLSNAVSSGESFYVNEIGPGVTTETRVALIFERPSMINLIALVTYLSPGANNKPVLYFSKFAFSISSDRPDYQPIYPEFVSSGIGDGNFDQTTAHILSGFSQTSGTIYLAFPEMNARGEWNKISDVADNKMILIDPSVRRVAFWETYPTKHRRRIVDGLYSLNRGQNARSRTIVEL